MRYKINVMTMNRNFLSFTINSYKVVDGDFIEFVDEYTGKTKRFHASNVEIEEVEDGR